jgi:hypothetical protein
MRIRSNTCLWGIPPAYSGHGRPHKHGKKFQLTNLEAWTPSDFSLELPTSSCDRDVKQSGDKLIFTEYGFHCDYCDYFEEHASSRITMGRSQTTR